MIKINIKILTEKDLAKYGYTLSNNDFNSKPGIEFDKKYNTNISESWVDYPNNLSEDEIYNISITNWSEYTNIANELTYEHFPYKGIETLDIKMKCDILDGMISGFNFDDIVYFSIDGIRYYMNLDVNNEIERYYNSSILSDIRWVMSPNTLMNLKTQLKGNLNVQ